MTDDIRQKIEELNRSAPVVLYMKGDLNFPQCGFSARAVQILKAAGVEAEKIRGIDVLSDMEIREGIKAYSNWPTIPQCYIKGEFVGGSDTMLEMFESGELKQLLTDLT